MKLRVQAAAVLFVISCVTASGHEISFDRSSVRSDDYVTLTIILEDEFVGTDHVKLPLENLTLIAGPGTSTEFRWVDGRTSRRKVLTYRLSPEGAGTAAVGPVIVTADNGDQLTLKRVTIDVVDPVRSELSSEDAFSLSRLPAVVVEVSTERAWVGEQIEVRWSVYGENIRGVQLLELPSLDGFWVEQLDADETNRELIRVGDEVIQRQTVRHVLLYPMRPGTFEIAPLAASVRVYRRDPLGDVRGWNPFGGSVTEVTRRSERVLVDVNSPPDPTLAVGSFELSCSDPRVPSQGPVSFDVTLTGAGNLRSVPSPQFSVEPAAGFEIEPLPISMQHRSGIVMMQRRWRYLLFPERSGDLRIPSLSFRFFDPGTESVRTATCGGWTVAVAPQTPVIVDRARSSVGEGRQEERSMVTRYWAPAVVSIVTILLLVPLLLRVRRRDDSARRLAGLVDRPAMLRVELERWMVRHGHHPARVKHQPGDIGDAWRGVSSLIDLVDREPWELERSRDELRRRILELVEEVRG